MRFKLGTESTISIDSAKIKIVAYRPSSQNTTINLCGKTMYDVFVNGQKAIVTEELLDFFMSNEKNLIEETAKDLGLQKEENITEEKARRGRPKKETQI